MVSPVRPSPFAQVSRPAEPTGNEAAKLAAQRAFFAALGKTAGPVGVAQTTAAAPAASPVARAPSAPNPDAAPGQRIPRPGSVLDIRV